MKKYLVIGNPIEHSLSPKLHNYWFKKNNINAIYEKRLVDENNLKKLCNEVKNGKLDGFNVTVPFKKEIIPYIDQLSIEAKNTQSVNTISFNNGKLIGHNTDIDGFELSIKKLKFDVANKKILILGAGGVVPSIIFALKKMKAFKIILSNRTKEKAMNLKNIFDNLTEGSGIKKETLEKEKSNSNVKGNLIKSSYITSTMGVSYKLKIGKTI